MNIALFGNNSLQFEKVYTEDILNELKKYGTLSTRINKKNLSENAEFLNSCEIAFATWGMPCFSAEEIEKYMPNLKVLFYSAGTVQYFARPFLENCVRVFSAYAANAIPVAEYTFAQITLASKGYFQAAKCYRILPLRAFSCSNSSPGNYNCKIGLVGLGAIGQIVAEKLKALDVSVYAYDPFVSKERAKELNVELIGLEDLFSTCDIISNHLANKKELKNIYNYKLFRLMKKHSTFINTGRGAQISEYSLAASLLLHPSKTFVADVLKREFFPYINPLFWCPNAIITPRIAGSMGNEPQRMARFMITEMDNYINNRDTKYEISLKQLETMA